MKRNKVYIYQSELKAIISASQKYLACETGGEVFGSFTHGKTPVIWFVTGPGVNAKEDSWHYQQDIKFKNEVTEWMFLNFGIQSLGAWHSHHTLGLKHPSSGDIETVKKTAINRGRKIGLDIIVNHEAIDGIKFRTVPRPYLYPNVEFGIYEDTEFEIIKRTSPVRYMLDKEDRIKKHEFVKDWENATEIFSPHNRTNSLGKSKVEISKSILKRLKNKTKQNIKVEYHFHAIVISTKNEEIWLRKSNISNNEYDIFLIQEDQDFKLNYILSDIESSINFKDPQILIECIFNNLEKIKTKLNI